MKNEGSFHCISFKQFQNLMRWGQNLYKGECTFNKLQNNTKVLFEVLERNTFCMWISKRLKKITFKQF